MKWGIIMQNASSMRLFQLILLFAIDFTVFGNNCVFANNQGNNALESSDKTKQPVFTVQRIDRRSTATALKIPDNFPLGIVSTIWLDDFALLKTATIEIHIAHPHIGDLLVQLECPNGQVVHVTQSGRRQ